MIRLLDRGGPSPALDSRSSRIRIRHQDWGVCRQDGRYGGYRPIFLRAAATPPQPGERLRLNAVQPYKTVDLFF